MPRIAKGHSIVIATHNNGKVAEISKLLENYGVRGAAAASFNLPEVEETGETFEANATIKALAAAEKSHMPSLADDSGLVVPALDGNPGIYSARWAANSSDFSSAMERVEAELDAKGIDPEGVKAHFICHLCLAWPGGYKVNVEGRVNGTLTFPPRGDKGFGYDPIFIPEGYEQTFGEMSAEQKESISHRNDAFRKLAAECF